MSVRERGVKRVKERKRDKTVQALTGNFYKRFMENKAKSTAEMRREREREKERKNGCGAN